MLLWYIAVNMIINLWIFGFAMIICGGNRNAKSNKVPLVQQQATSGKSVQSKEQAPIKTAIEQQTQKKSKESKPPPNVPVAAAKPNDHTLREVESIRFEGSRE